MQTSTNDLIIHIRKEIEANNGSISFDRFMELALYHSEQGYYCSENFMLGKEGDFITAPHISPLFAQCVAHQAIQVFPHLQQKNILELGAGLGQFACDFLNELNQQQSLPSHYYIYEISHRLRKKQQNLLQTKCPALYSRCIWLEKLPENFSGLVIANEVLDAFPVHTFRVENNSIKERCVAYEKDEFVWKLREPTSLLAEKAEAIRKQYHLENGYESEINLRLPTFMEELGRGFTQGLILFIDYGYGEEEYYHPERSHGSLTCFYQHKHHANPLICPGLQDITAHVNFTALIENAAANNFELAGFTTQAGFLFSLGLMDFVYAAEQQLSETDKFALHQAVKQLTMPTEMGERIKVMALSKGLDLDLPAFSLQDRRRDL